MSRFGIVEDDEVELMIESSRKGMHRTLEGQMVAIGSPECRDDILRRMDDMGYHRDDHGYGSDARTYFTGVLKVLRRKLRENDKIASEASGEKQEDVIEESGDFKDRRLEENNANRMLKLAGLID